VFGGKLPSQPTQTCFSSVVVNVGEARAQGVEIETTYQLSQGLRISLGGAYTDVEVAEDISDLGLSKGDRLPSSPDYNINLGLEYEYELGGYASYVRGDYAYVSEYFNRVGEEGDKGGDYGQLNMSAGITLNKFNINLFAQNLTNEDTVTNVGTLFPDTRAYRLRPRTIGLNIGYQF
jgi:outer membrane receptor protein involved in Fe transport